METSFFPALPHSHYFSSIFRLASSRGKLRKSDCAVHRGYRGQSPSFLCLTLHKTNPCHLYFVCIWRTKCKLEMEKISESSQARGRHPRNVTVAFVMFFQSRLVSVQEIKSVQKFTFKIFRLRSVQFSSPSGFVQVQFKKSVQLKKNLQLVAIKMCFFIIYGFSCLFFGYICLHF